jgi:2'-5' RNA ligase
MRLFVATALPSDDGLAYARQVDDLATKTGVALRRVPEGSAHITHAFLGEVSDGEAGVVVRVMTEALKSESATDVELGAPEVLTARNGPRAVIVPLARGAAGLYQLEMRLVFALRTIPALATLPMPKAPHVTIARFGRSSTRRDGQRVSEALARHPVPPRPLLVDRIQLMSSTLTPNGPVYEEVAGVVLPTVGAVLPSR